MNKFAAAVVCAVLMLTVLVAPVFSQSVQGDPKAATICFYRPQRADGWPLKPSVFIDGKDVGRIHNGDTFTVSVAPGEHQIHSTDKSTGIALAAEAGQTYKTQAVSVLSVGTYRRRIASRKRSSFAYRAVSQPMRIGLAHGISKRRDSPR